ncbi:MAG TPA: hypothetical protein VKG44_01460 [Candidatus Baltobacteraceae bacterium]|nr:hypothetical protein [Candidatus Baltobacteraceae bacterium]
MLLRFSWLARAAFLALAATLPANAQTATVYGYTWSPAAPATTSPAILKVELNSDHLQAGGPIAIRVSTTPDVVKVVTGNGPRSGALTSVAPGIFTSQATLPRVGGIASVKIKLHFVATTADGKSAAVDVPVSYR